MTRPERVRGQPAYVLHRRPYRNTSALLEIFSQEYGRVGLVARGALRTPRLQSLLQPFQPLLLSWTRRGELGTLTGSEPAALPPPLEGEALFCGYYLNELILALSPRDIPQKGIFASYEEALEALRDTTGRKALAAILRLFEKRLLEALGYGLLLDKEAGGTPIEPERAYRYRLERGAFREGEGIPVTGATLLALFEERPEKADAREAKRLLQGALSLYLPAPLKTPVLFRKLQPCTQPSC